MPFKTYVLAATALALLPTAAMARDRAPYIGIQGGVTKPEKIRFDYDRRTASVDDVIRLEHRTGFDLDFIAGYDFGFIRLEGEASWKRAGIEDIQVSPPLLSTATGRLAAEGRTRVLSSMANLLLDFGSDDGLQVYAGGGLGRAQIDVETAISGPGVPAGRRIDGRDNSLAWQLIAGFRVPVTYNLDLGLKYRYFNSDVEFSDNDAGVIETLDGKFRSHSLLASLIFNLGSPPAPPLPPVIVQAPPPPAPPPATQTCPDGSVILATDVCPLPPAPPPPPEPAPVRG